MWGIIDQYELVSFRKSTSYGVWFIMFCYHSISVHHKPITDYWPPMKYRTKYKTRHMSRKQRTISLLERGIVLLNRATTTHCRWSKRTVSTAPITSINCGTPQHANQLTVITQSGIQSISAVRCRQKYSDRWPLVLHSAGKSLKPVI